MAAPQMNERRGEGGGGALSQPSPRGRSHLGWPPETLLCYFDLHQGLSSGSCVAVALAALHLDYLRRRLLPSKARANPTAYRPLFA